MKNIAFQPVLKFIMGISYPTKASDLQQREPRIVDYYTSARIGYSHKDIGRILRFRWPIPRQKVPDIGASGFSTTSRLYPRSVTTKPWKAVREVLEQLLYSLSCTVRHLT